jgi:limonene-1,2-epoxide hydrolase
MIDAFVTGPVVINEHEIRDGRIAAWREYLEPALFARS